MTDGLIVPLLTPPDVYVLEFAGEDDALATLEATQVTTGLEPGGAGLAFATDIALDRVTGLAFTRRVSEVIGRTDPTIEAAGTLLAGTEIDRTGTVAVRARNVRGVSDVDTQATERTLGRELTDRGFAVDLETPDHELRALFSEEMCILGWLVGESTRTFGDRAPTDKPFFQPGSMDPILARSLVNLAGAGPGRVVVDPMCGTGGILVEAGLVGADVVGLDAQRKMVRGAQQNLAEVADVTYAVLQGDATCLPLRDDVADGVVFDAPYGRQSKIIGDLETLIDGALSESRRVASRAVVVGDRSWAPVARSVGWTVAATHERRTHRSLTRHIVVLKRDDTP